MTKNEKQAYNKSYYQRNKDYWRRYYASHRGVGKINPFDGDPKIRAKKAMQDAYETASYLRNTTGPRATYAEILDLRQKRAAERDAYNQKRAAERDAYNQKRDLQYKIRSWNQIVHAPKPSWSKAKAEGYKISQGIRNTVKKAGKKTMSSISKSLSSISKSLKAGKDFVSGFFGR